MIVSVLAASFAGDLLHSKRWRTRENDESAGAV